jgi:methyl-accepting chemotaxis protein
MQHPGRTSGEGPFPPRWSRRLVAAAAFLGLACVTLLPLVAVFLWAVPFPLGAAQALLLAALGSASSSLGLVVAELRARRASRHLAHRKLAELIPTVSALADHFIGAATEIQAMSGQQREGALNQTSAVGETHRALQEMLASARQVADSAEVVHTNAAATLANNERVVALVSTLSENTKEIERTVAQLRAIATKSEVLTLNAALEGRRAGEAGRGFSLVAAQMQALTESIASSLAGITGLTGTIAGATASTQDALREATAWAHSTTEAGRTIAVISREQHGSTEQVVSAVSDIAEITQRVADGSARIVESASALEELARQLVVYLAELEQA